jgi:hypothetical protein
MRLIIAAGVAILVAMLSRKPRDKSSALVNKSRQFVSNVNWEFTETYFAPGLSCDVNCVTHGVA